MEFTHDMSWFEQDKFIKDFNKEVCKLVSLMGLTMVHEDVCIHKDLFEKVTSDPLYVYNTYVLKGVDPITPESPKEDITKATEYMDKNYPALRRLFPLKQV